MLNVFLYFIINILYTYVYYVYYVEHWYQCALKSVNIYIIKLKHDKFIWLRQNIYHAQKKMLKVPKEIIFFQFKTLNMLFLYLSSFPIIQNTYIIVWVSHGICLLLVLHSFIIFLIHHKSSHAMVIIMIIAVHPDSWWWWLWWFQCWWLANALCFAFYFWCIFSPFLSIHTSNIMTEVGTPGTFVEKKSSLWW